MANPDVSALAAYAGQYEQGLFSTMVNGLEVGQDIRVIQNVKHKLNMTKLKATPGAKPFTSSEEYAGSLTYSPRVLDVSPGKVEMLIDVEEYRSTWMSEQLSPGSHANKKEVPFAQYVWEQVMMELASEINDKTAFFGIDKSDATAFAAGSTYTAGDYITYTDNNGINSYYECLSNTSAGEDPEDTPAKWKKIDAEAIAQGFAKIIADEITASNLTATATGVIDNTSGQEAYAAQLKLFRSQATAYKKMVNTIFQSYTDYELLLDDLQTTLQYTLSDIESLNAPGGGIYLPYTNRRCIAKPASWMGDSRRLVCTPSQNLIMGTDLLSDMNQIEVLEGAKLWTLPVGIKFVVGFQIRDLDALKVGDQT